MPCDNQTDDSAMLQRAGSRRCHVGSVEVACGNNGRIKGLHYGSARTGTVRAHSRSTLKSVCAF